MDDLGIVPTRLTLVNIIAPARLGADPTGADGLWLLYMFMCKTDPRRPEDTDRADRRRGCLFPSR